MLHSCQPPACLIYGENRVRYEKKIKQNWKFCSILYWPEWVVDGSDLCAFSAVFSTIANYSQDWPLREVRQKGKVQGRYFLHLGQAELKGRRGNCEHGSCYSCTWCDQTLCTSNTLNCVDGFKVVFALDRVHGVEQGVQVVQVHPQHLNIIVVNINIILSRRSRRGSRRCGT